jgi:hypothetical protein
MNWAQCLAGRIHAVIGALLHKFREVLGVRQDARPTWQEDVVGRDIAVRLTVVFKSFVVFWNACEVGPGPAVQGSSL